MTDKTKPHIATNPDGSKTHFLGEIVFSLSVGEKQQPAQPKPKE